MSLSAFVAGPNQTFEWRTICCKLEQIFMSFHTKALSDAQRRMLQCALPKGLVPYCPDGCFCIMFFACLSLMVGCFSDIFPFLAVWQPGIGMVGHDLTLCVISAKMDLFQTNACPHYPAGIYKFAGWACRATTPLVRLLVTRRSS